MKLPIKKKYFDMIKEGKKDIEYRDAHLTLVCEETGEIITAGVYEVWIENINNVPYSECLGDMNILCFRLDDIELTKVKETGGD